MKRIPELDSLRGIAAVAILAFHFAPGWLPFGWSAVDFFFVLSGYLITTILLEHRDSPRTFQIFYIRRSLRIWPIYYLVLLSLTVFVWWLGDRAPESYSLEGLPFYLTYTQNIELYWGGQVAPFLPAFSHTWTLAIEEQFYLFWPLIVYCVGPRLLPFTTLVVLAGGVAARMSGLYPFLLVSRCDGFALGGLLAGLFYLHADRARRWAVILAACGTAGWFALALAKPDWLPHGLRNDGFGTLILPLSAGYFVILEWVVKRAGQPLLAPLRWKWLTYLGAISYGLYLYHVPVMHGAEVAFRRMGFHHTFGPERPLYRGVIEMVITLAVAAVSWHFVERPILSLKDRFNYRSKPAAERASDN